MKKLITTLAVVLTLGFVTLQTANAAPTWGGDWGCNGPGYGRFENSEEAKKAYEARDQFYADTTDLRKKLYEKRSEYYDMINQETVDKEVAKELWSEVFDLQTEIQKLASEKGVGLAGPDYCLGPDGYFEGAERSSFRGGRGNQRGWMMNTTVRGGRGYHQGDWMMGSERGYMHNIGMGGSGRNI